MVGPQDKLPSLVSLYWHPLRHKAPMSHLDSPLERLAALERVDAGMRNATGATLKGNPNAGFVGKDLDGDGKLSLAERLDADGDGKISMDEFAMMSKFSVSEKPGDEVSHAARSCGAKSEEERKGWAAFRKARVEGQWVPTNTERIAEQPAKMTFSPEKGGWISPDRGASPTHEGNRNVLPADYVPPENPYLPKFDHEFGESAAWDVGSCERRCDGDRVTEYVKASDWLFMRDPGNRGPDVNPLQSNVRGNFPPALPKYMARDHMHDRNREMALHDPARPGLETYVRVTRRVGPPEVEAQLHQQKKERQALARVREKEHVQDANELLALRSMLIQDALTKNKEANMKVAAGEWKKDQPPPPQDPVAERAEQLNKKLGIDKVELVTMPLHIDDTPGAMTWGPLSLHKPVEPPPPPPKKEGKEVPSRGGAWPVDTNYFKTPPATAAAQKMLTSTGRLKTRAVPSG